MGNTKSTQSDQKVQSTRDEQEITWRSVSTSEEIELLQSHALNWSEFSDATILKEGHNGIVVKATYNHGISIPVVIKELPKHHVLSHPMLRWTDFKNEAVSLLKIGNHSSLINMLGVVLEPRFMIVTEFANGGTLEDLIKNSQQPLSFTQRVQIALDISQALEYLHSIGYIHRDLAARNVLLKKDEHSNSFRAVVTDFGLCVQVFDGIFNHPNNTLSRTGPVRIMAPESIDYTINQFTKKSDVWSFGIMMYSIFSRKRPYGNATTAQLREAILNNTAQLPPYEDFEEGMKHDVLKNIYDSALTRDPLERISFAEISKALQQLVYNNNNE